MKRAACVLAWALCACSGHRPAAEPLVDFHALHPAAVLDIRYATADNFTHQAVYPVARCALRRSVAERLDLAAQDLERRGWRLKVFDCYRPLSVQKVFWRLVPDERYVADPKKGSRHNRGAAVDVSLTDAQGADLEMPTGYDDFTERAHRDWDRASPAARENRKLLEDVMQAHGFAGLPTEWWHFDAKGWESYPVADIPLQDVR